MAAALLFVRGAGAGTIRGTVTWSGEAPPLAPVPTTKDRAVCGEAVEDESLVVEKGRVANVILRLHGAPPGVPVRVTLDQERCRFRPRVQTAPLGSTLEVTNADPILHTAHGWAGRVTRFDLVTPRRQARGEAKLDRPGLVQVRCDVHSWMVAWILVAEGAATVTARDGTFTLSGVPAGTHTVTAWHERLGEKSAEVTVPAQGEVRLDLRYANGDTRARSR
jgi:plastocyanin